MKKVIKILGVTLMLVMIMSTLCFALKVPEPTPKEIDGKAGETVGNVLGIMQSVGLVCAVGMGIFLGIKYVGASPEGKSQLKEQLGLYILGIVFILGSVAIVTLIKNTVAF